MSSQRVRCPPSACWRQWRHNREQEGSHGPTIQKYPFRSPTSASESTKTRHFVIEKSKNAALHSILRPLALDLALNLNCFRRHWLKGRKHFSQSVRPMVFVAVSKLSKTHLVLMQPGAKINNVYYCDNVLEQELLPGIRRLSNDDFLFQQYGAPGTRLTPDCRLPALPFAWVHWTRKLATKQSASKSCDLLVWGGATDGVLSQKFRQWPAETRANRLLGSAKPGHVKSSDRSAAKKTDDSYQSQRCLCWITSGLTVCANDRCCFTVLWVKIE